MCKLQHVYTLQWIIPVYDTGEGVEVVDGSKEGKRGREGLARLDEQSG